MEARRTIEMNPNDANTLGPMGNILAFIGDWDWGAQLAERAISWMGPNAPRGGGGRPRSDTGSAANTSKL